LRAPNAWLLGVLTVALALTAFRLALSALPKFVSNAAQLIIGLGLGAQFTPAFMQTAPRWVACVAAGALLMIAACAGFAWILAQFSGLHPATLTLATSPGGIAEMMCITAKVLQLGVPIVTAFHVSRLAAVLLLAEPIFRRLGRGT